MAETVIKAGYRLTCRSWENDADNYRTITHDGLTEPQARFVCDLLNHLQSINSGVSNVWGNMYHPSPSQREDFACSMMEVANQHGQVARDMLGLDDPDRSIDVEDLPYVFVEFLYDYHGGGEFFTRVTDRLKVEFVPEDIYLDDVTEDFV